MFIIKAQYIVFTNFVIMRMVVLVCIFVTTSLRLYSQELLVIDSLIERLGVAVGEDKIHTLIQLSEAYRYEDFDLCIDYGKKAARLAEEGGSQGYLAFAFKSLGRKFGRI